MTDTQLGRYHLIRVLGQGAMGVVYEARDPHLDRSVALKTARTRDLPPDQVATYERRFLTEARSAARLRHPSIVSVFDAGKDGEVTYLVMELVDGVNLKHCLNNGVRFTPAGAGRLVLSVLNGLEHAHEQRVIHRDVKPENVLLDQTGVAKLTDFGIAKLLESDMDNGTQLAGLSIGTPRYMSPEQVRGLPVDTRTDLYSVGVLLFELLTAQVPFDGTNHLSVAAQILHDPAPLPSVRTPGVSPVLDALVAKALAKSPDDRFQTADAFRQALTQTLGHHALMPTEAELGAEPALALVEPDAAPILRWLFAQARANRPVAPVPASATAQPAAVATVGEPTSVTIPSLPQSAGPQRPEPLDGTRVAQREAYLAPSVGTIPIPPVAPLNPAPTSPVSSGSVSDDNGTDATLVSTGPLPPSSLPPSPQSSPQAVPVTEMAAATVPLVQVPPVLRSARGAPAPVRKKPWGLIALALLLVGAATWWAVGRQPAAVQPLEEIIEDTRPRPAAAAAPATGALPAPVDPAVPVSPAPVGGAAPGVPSADASPTPATTGATGTTPKPTPAEAARARREAKAKADAAAKAAAEAQAQAGDKSSGQTEEPPSDPVVKPKDVTAPAPAPKPAAPREPCVGLSFFERESCLWKQCYTEAFRRHPACQRFNPDKSATPQR